VKICKRISDVVIALILVYLAVLFVVSAFLSWKTTQDDMSISRQVITSYATQYLTNERLVKEGRAMDCSSFTSAVFKKFGIQLPRSSKEQFKNYLTQDKELFPADLVFFKNDYNTVSHVGLILTDSTFIHSPGRNKAVRIDSLKHEYWKNCLIGTGSVLKTREKHK
jgi:cell wall-associated NlpC family hydrolase